MSRLNVLSKILNSYTRLLNTHRYKVQLVQFPVIMGVGDVLAQTVIEKVNEPMRTLKFMAIGAALGPSMEKFYEIVERKIGSISKTSSRTANLKMGLKKTILDQLLCNPPVIAFVLSAIPLMDGEGWEGVKTTLRREYKDVLINSYLVWPAIQIVNFSFVPMQYRVLYIAVFDALWNAYVSWAAHSTNSIK